MRLASNYRGMKNFIKNLLTLGISVASGARQFLPICSVFLSLYEIPFITYPYKFLS